MRILQLCPLWFPVSRDAPGGIETFVAQLTRALTGRGHQITTLASGDSSTAGELVPVIPDNLCRRLEAGTAWEYVYYEQHQLQLALERAPDFDLIHSHIGHAAYLLSNVRELRGRVLHTVHWPVYRDLEWLAERHPEMWFSTVSEFQARKLRRRGAARCHAIPNGIDVREFTLRPRGSDELVYIGRMEWGKGPDLAVRAARALGRPLTLAGPVVEGPYFEQQIKPHLDGNIRYLGVVDHRRKAELFGRAACVVLPFRREEPFGLVAIEAMACGTPVVALANGALPEIVEPGITGYLARDEEEELATVVDRATHLDRPAIRERVAARFEISIIAEQYERLYREIVSAGPQPEEGRRPDWPDIRRRTRAGRSLEEDVATVSPADAPASARIHAGGA